MSRAIAPPYIQLKAMIKLAAVNSLNKRPDLDVNMPLDFLENSPELPPGFRIILPQHLVRTIQISPLFYACTRAKFNYEICQILVERGGVFQTTKEKDHVISQLYMITLLKDPLFSSQSKLLLDYIELYKLLLVNHVALGLTEDDINAIKNVIETKSVIDIYAKLRKDYAWSRRGLLIKHYDAATRRRKYNQRKSRKWRQRQ